MGAMDLTSARDRARQTLGPRGARWVKIALAAVLGVIALLVAVRVAGAVFKVALAVAVIAGLVWVARRAGVVEMLAAARRERSRD